MIRARAVSIIIVLLAICSVLQARAASADEQRQAVLVQRLDELIKPFEGRVSLFARNLDSGAQFGIDADLPVRTASTIKLPIAMAVEQLVAEGRHQWSERLTVSATDKVSGSGVLSDFSDGESISLIDAVTLMIIVSDNTATNLILDRVDGDRVNAYLAALGLERTRVMRKIRGDGTQLKPAQGWTVEGLKPENQRYGIGVSTPREMVRLLELLEAGQVVDAQASRRLLRVLERQQYKDGIGRRQSDYRVASKSGALDALRSDVGIVYTPGGRVAIAVTVDGMPQIDYSPDNVGQLLIADITEVLLQELR
jgi:beta-lactamase class A